MLYLTKPIIYNITFYLAVQILLHETYHECKKPKSLTWIKCKFSYPAHAGLVETVAYVLSIMSM